MSKKVLITGVGGDIGQSIIKCLKDIHYNLYLLGCDIDLYAAGKSKLNKFYQVPKASEFDKYFDVIQKLTEEEKINYILPTTEAEIEFYDNHRDYFDKRNIIIFINNSFIIETFFDKYKTINFLKNNNLPHPRTYLLEDYNDRLAFPFLLKPRRGYGCKGLIVIHDSDELNLYRKRTKNYVVQEIIGAENEEYTVTVFSTGKESFSIAFRRYLGYGSLTKVAHVIYDEAIKSLVEKIARFSLLKGSLNIQCRKTDAGYIPFEINSRFSSTVYTRHCFGFQDVKWWIDMVKGRKIEYIPQYKEGTAVRTIGEVFFNLVSW